MDIESINSDRNLIYFNTPIKVISIYDHHLFDRSDYDTLSKPQRDHLEYKLKDFGWQRKSGRKIFLSKTNQTLIFPKPNILGGSPFDTLRYEKSDNNVVFVLTPTQADCYELGASNFVQKPINNNILIAIIKKNINMLSQQTRDEIKLKNIIININNFQCIEYHSDKNIALTRTEINILHSLARRPNIIISKDKLTLMGKDSNSPMGYKALEMHIVSLRKKLKGLVEIQTHKGLGYSLNN
jgi:DNA-binding response OmpR family regulator